VTRCLLKRQTTTEKIILRKKHWGKRGLCQKKKGVGGEDKNFSNKKGQSLKNQTPDYCFLDSSGMGNEGFIDPIKKARFGKTNVKGGKKGGKEEQVRGFGYILCHLDRK